MLNRGRTSTSTASTSTSICTWRSILVLVLVLANLVLVLSLVLGHKYLYLNAILFSIICTATSKYRRKIRLSAPRNEGASTAYVMPSNMATKTRHRSCVNENNARLPNNWSFSQKSFRWGDLRWLERSSTSIVFSRTSVPWGSRANYTMVSYCLTIKSWVAGVD